ncbi:thiol reductase thioredoxin [Sporosarcina sp. P37]|uniref:thiol reductase thioredoxin n=1 Tax=unclassified Sporosarcina TaxID=2647733 RepID=UPI0009BFB8BF|nr:MULTISPECIES: thiol reductase thioredoxin [unclassified Sporosarcina]ARD49365.1 thiol reductase thioredoxin [Sporosarcina sp. P33]ARK25838.1 thiol reductase thioredoxin [Sporosarcina sp. P37]PID19138.1 thiol reductase thioredoxin [Sporosarcina sp. P35]
MFTAYEETVAAFDKIDSAKALDLVKGEDEAVIYIGKSVCPYCQKFVGKLKKASEETNTHIYYVDSAEASDMKGITAFRNEYEIPTVPGFVYTDGSSVHVKCDSSMPEEEIKSFMNK